MTQAVRPTGTPPPDAGPVERFDGLRRGSAGPPGRLRPSRLEKRSSRRALLAAAPALALLVLFLGAPIVDGLRLSFSSWGGTGPISWVGLRNYRDMFDNGFATTLWLTVRYSVLSTLGIVILASLMAAAISLGVGGARVYRIIWFVPGIAPIAAVSVFWSIAFQPTTGVVNVFLGKLGLGSTHTWLASPTAAIYPAVFVTIWAGVGFAFLVLLGAMEQIPVSLFEAARLDGASWGRIYRSIMLPMARPVIGVVALLEMIWSFNGFTTIWGMTQGGPGYATSTVPVMVYREAFEETNFGTASSMAVVGGLILVLLGVVMLRVSRSRQVGAS